MESTRTSHILNPGAAVRSIAPFLIFPGGESDEALGFASFAGTQEELEGVQRHLD